MTEEALRVTIFGHISINASVKWLGTSIPFYDTSGVPWIENILVPELRWGDGDSYKRWALENWSRPSFGGRSVSWRGTVPFCPNYLPSSPVNARAGLCRVCDVRLQ